MDLGIKDVGLIQLDTSKHVTIGVCYAVPLIAAEQRTTLRDAIERIHLTGLSFCSLFNSLRASLLSHRSTLGSFLQGGNSEHHIQRFGWVDGTRAKHAPHGLSNLRLMLPFFQCSMSVVGFSDSLFELVSAVLTTVRLIEFTVALTICSLAVFVQAFVDPGSFASRRMNVVCLCLPSIHLLLFSQTRKLGSVTFGIACQRWGEVRSKLSKSRLNSQLLNTSFFVLHVCIEKGSTTGVDACIVVNLQTQPSFLIAELSFFQGVSSVLEALTESTPVFLERNNAGTNGLLFVNVLGKPFVFGHLALVDLFVEVGLGFSFRSLKDYGLAFFHDTMNVKHTTAGLTGLEVRFRHVRCNHTGTPVHQLLSVEHALSFFWHRTAKVYSALTSLPCSSFCLGIGGSVVLYPVQGSNCALEEGQPPAFNRINDFFFSASLYQSNLFSPLFTSNLQSIFRRHISSSGHSTGTCFNLQGIELDIDSFVRKLASGAQCSACSVFGLIKEELNLSIFAEIIPVFVTKLTCHLRKGIRTSSVTHHGRHHDITVRQLKCQVNQGVNVLLLTTVPLLSNKLSQLVLSHSIRQAFGLDTLVLKY